MFINKCALTGKAIRYVKYFVPGGAKEHSDDSLRVAYLLHAIEVVDYAEKNQRMDHHILDGVRFNG